MCNKRIEALVASQKHQQIMEFIFVSGILSSQFLYFEKGLQKHHKDYLRKRRGDFPLQITDDTSLFKFEIIVLIKPLL